MKTMTVGKFKSNFSEILEQVKAGEKIAVTFGKKKNVVGYFVADLPYNKRQLGLLEGKAQFSFSDDLKLLKRNF